MQHEHDHDHDKQRNNRHFSHREHDNEQNRSTDSSVNDKADECKINFDISGKFQRGNDCEMDCSDFKHKDIFTDNAYVRGFDNSMKSSSIKNTRVPISANSSSSYSNYSYESSDESEEIVDDDQRGSDQTSYSNNHPYTELPFLFDNSCENGKGEGQKTIPQAKLYWFIRESKGMASWATIILRFI